MSNETFINEPRCAALKSEAARQRWELFHQAIAHAKQANAEAQKAADDADQADRNELAASRVEPQLSIAR